jgi:hypothetical protein
MAEGEPYHKPSPGCANVRAERYWGRDQEVPFPLLKSCRVIYEEAKLFPVKYNYFMFTNDHSLSWFQAKYPLPIQLQAIERIAFATEDLGPLGRDKHGPNQEFTQLVPLSHFRTSSMLTYIYMVQLRTAATRRVFNTKTGSRIG